MESNNIAKYAIKPAVMAGITMAGTAMWRPKGMVSIIGNRAPIPLPLVVGAVTFIAAEASALINTYLFPHIPVINVLEAPMHTALTIGVQTTVTAGVENFIAPGLVGDLGISELVAFAVIAEVGSSYVTDYWITPMLSRYNNTY